MLSTEQIENAFERSKKAQENYEEELIRIIDEVMEESKKVENSFKPEAQIIEELMQRKKETDQRFVDAERTLHNARMEIKAMVFNF